VDLVGNHGNDGRPRKRPGIRLPDSRLQRRRLDVSGQRDSWW
jgi:hypothetical protein